MFVAATATSTNTCADVYDNNNIRPIQSCRRNVDNRLYNLQRILIFNCTYTSNRRNGSRRIWPFGRIPIAYLHTFRYSKRRFLLTFPLHARATTYLKTLYLLLNYNSRRPAPILREIHYWHANVWHSELPYIILLRLVRRVGSDKIGKTYIILIIHSKIRPSKKHGIIYRNRS